MNTHDLSRGALAQKGFKAAIAVALMGLASSVFAADAAAYDKLIDEKAAAAESQKTVEVQAPVPAIKQGTALTNEEWNAIIAKLPKGSRDGGLAAHGKHFCSSCHGGQGLAPTDQWPDVSGQPALVTIKALLDYRDGRRKATPAAGMMAAAAAKLTDQEIVDLAALYEDLPGRGADKPSAGTPAPLLVTKGDPSRYITPCASCHGMDAKGNPNNLVPVIQGQQAKVLAEMLKDYRSQKRTSDMYGEMRVFAKSLTDQEIDELAKWYATEPGRPGSAQPSAPAAK